MDAASSFAHNIANIRFEDIPADVVRVAKMDVLDTLGTALAASKLAPSCREVVEFVKEGGGKEESTILAFGGRVPSWMAAFANGTMAHSLDYDDCHEPARMHAGVSVVPASFAVAERTGKVSGKMFITAVTLGIDLSCRLSLVTPIEPRGFHPTGVCGFFGAATAAGKILGLREQALQNSLGIAYSQAAGNFQAVADAALTKRMQAGFAAKGGVLSALLAAKGITGATNSLEGEFGLYKVYYGGKCDTAALTSELGERFEVSNLSFKPYPSSRGTHASIDATLGMVREHHIRPQDIQSIKVSKYRVAAQVLGEPIERKRRPENVVDAQFNIPYTVASAVVRGHVGLGDFTPEAIKDPAVLQVAQKVSLEVNPEFSTFIPGITEIRTKGGNAYSRRIDEPSGSPANPIPQEQLIQKFRDCASHSVKPLSEEHLKKVIDMVMNIELLDDVGAITGLLT